MSKDEDLNCRRRVRTFEQLKRKQGNEGGIVGIF